MRCFAVRTNSSKHHNLSHLLRPRPFSFGASIIAWLLLTGQTLAAPVIRISGPVTVITGTEVVLRGEALNPSAAEILQSDGFFEWRIGGNIRATGTIFRCRSNEPAEYAIELRLCQRVGSRIVTFAADRRTLSFKAPSIEQDIEEKTAPVGEASATPPAATWVLRFEETHAETNEMAGARQQLEVRANEAMATSVHPDAGIIEARVRWPALPSNLTPGRYLVFDLQQTLRLTPNAGPVSGAPLTTELKSRFFVTSEYKNERMVDGLSVSAVNAPERAAKTKRIQWLIPNGQLGDRLTLELGSESVAGTASRLYTYVLESQPSKQASGLGSLHISLYAERTNIPVGAATAVKARISGGAQPVRFRWYVDGLSRMDAGDVLTFRAERPGPARIVCEAVDAIGREAQSALTLEGVAPLLNLFKTTPPGNRVFVGEPVVWRAEVTGTTALPTEQIAFRWSGSDSVFFDSQETKLPTNRSRCYAVGVATVLVELIYRPAPAVVEFVARSAPFPLTISPPNVLLVFDPPNPMIGQEVMLTVRTDPPVTGFECRWNEMPTNILMLGRSADSRELKFVPTNADPARFRTTLVLPRTGTPLAEGFATLAAQRYTVSISGPVGGEPKPLVWREGVGAVTAETEFAQFQPLNFAADLVPSGAASRWVWSVKPSSYQIQTEMTSSVTVVCTETGRYEIVARAYDARGVELGAARKAFTVSISTQETTMAARRMEAQSLREKGYALLQAGHLREAVEAYRASYAGWPTEELKRHIEQLERQMVQAISAAEQADALRREEEKRNAEAEQLKQAAWEHIRKRNYDEGLEAFRRSLALKPDPELAAQVGQIRDALEKRRARQATAAQWEKQAEALEAAGRLQEALAAYRASLQSWTDDRVEQRVAQLERKVAEQEAALAKAAELVARAERLEQQGDWAAALAAYRESLTLHSHAEIAARAARLEERRRQEEADRQSAKRLCDEAEALLQKGDVEDALLKFRESLRLCPDDAIAHKARQAEARLEKERQGRERAAQLRDEAAALALDGKLDEALARYRESVGLWPNPELQNRIQELEAQISHLKGLREEAARLAAEAADMEKQEKWSEAVALYRNSLQKQPDPDIAARVARLEERLRQQEAQQTTAQKLARAADELVANGELEEGLLKYRESMRLWPDPAVSEKARAAEERLNAQKQAHEKAVALKDEAAACVLAGQFEAALAKYRQSVELQPDPDVQQRIQQLETEIEQQQAARQQAEQWASEGARLEAEQKWAEALAAYRKSVAFVPDNKISANIRALEARLFDENQKRLQAAAWREQASAAVAAGKFEKAIELYRQSLNLERNETAEQQIAALEKRLQARKAAADKAAQLYQEGLVLEQQERWEDAADKYRECLALADHPEARKRLAFVRRQISQVAAQKEKMAEAARVKEANARKLREEGLALQQKGQMAEAAARYRASLDLIPDPELEQLLRETEKTAAEMAGRNAAAAALREEAREAMVSGRYEEAVRKCEESLALRPDPAVEDAMARARKEWEKEKQNLACAQDLRRQAADAEKQGKWAEAAALLRQSLSYASDPEVRTHTARLEARAREQLLNQQAQAAAFDARKTTAARLRDEARDLESKGRIEDALLKYRASLEIWDDPELKTKVADLEARQARQKQLEEKARNFEAEAAALEQQGRLDEALAAYRSSFQIQSNIVVQQHIAALEQQAAQALKKREEAKRWMAEGEQHAKEARFDEAIMAFKTSLSLHPDAAVQEKLAAVEAQREQAARRRAEALRLRDEAAALLEQNKLEEALKKYRQSADIWPDEKVEKQIAQLSKRLEKQKKDLELAERLRKEASQLEREGRKEEALSKYRESLGLEPDPAIQALVAQWQQEIEREHTTTETADRLWREGMTQYRSGKRPEGLALLRQSLNVQADVRRADVLKQLENLAGPAIGTPPPHAPAAAVAPPPSPAVARTATSVAPDSTRQPVARVPVQQAAARPSRLPPAEDSYWDGVILFNTADESHQWPLKVTVHAGGNGDISGGFEERDKRTGRIIRYSVSGVLDPAKKIWYMAYLRNDGQITQKATLSGQSYSDDIAGGSISVLLGGVSGREPIKGIWRLRRVR